MIKLLDEIWSSIRTSLLRNKVGTITIEEATGGESHDFPVRAGCLRGRLTPLHENQAYFKPYGSNEVYFTYQVYGEWAGAVVEAEIELDSGSFDVGVKGFMDYPVKGWAYRVFIRNTGDLMLYELPEPEKILSGQLGTCRCPFCLGAKLA